MTERLMPTGEIIELIKGQARMEEKLDAFLRVQTSMKIDLDAVKKDVALLKQGRAIDKAFIAAISSIVSASMIFLVPFFKKILGI